MYKKVMFMHMQLCGNFLRVEKYFRLSAVYIAHSQTITRTKNKTTTLLGAFLFVVQVTGLDRALRLRLAR